MNNESDLDKEVLTELETEENKEKISESVEKPSTLINEEDKEEILKEEE